MSDETKPDQPAATKDLVDSALNFSTNLLTVLDLPASVLKNVYKALGRLSSAAIEVPVAFLEGKSAEIRAKSEARSKIIAEGTDQIIQQMNVPSEYAQVAVDKYVGKIIGEQLNLDKISAIAVNELKSGEPISSTNQDTSESNQGQSTSSTNQDANSSEEKIISDVWLNIFETEARSKSTEEMQLRFGRILAGEIQKPGAYSIRAIKRLGELDQDTAALFKKFCSACVVVETLGIPNSEQVFDARVLSLGGSLGSNVLSKYGLGLDQLKILNEYSLITSGDISLHDHNLASLYDYNLCIEHEDNPVLLPFQHQGKYWTLSPMPERDNSPEFRLSGVMLSRVGCELFPIVDQDPMLAYTEDLKKFFAEQNLSMIEVNSP